MVRISTIYDKVIEDDKEVSKKFFMVRGDERYARTTDTLITVTETGDYGFEGYYVTIRAEVLRCLGSSVCNLYDDEEMIGSFNTTSNVKTHTFTNLQVGYGEHKFYAVFNSNERCMGSRSKTITSTMDIPAEYKVNIVFDNTTVFASNTASKTITLTGVKATSTYANKSVKIYVDGVEYTTVTTDSNAQATVSLTNVEDGNHTITAEVPIVSEVYYGTTESQSISIGYNLSIMSYPTTFLNDGTDKVNVSVLDYNNNPVTGATVTFATYTATTDSNGVASITIPYIEDGTYSATCGGDSSESIQVHAIGVTGLTLTTDKSIVQDGETALLTATVTGGRSRSIPVTFTLESGETATLNTDANGRCQYVYNGTGVGDNIATATVNGYTASVNIEDAMLYFTPDKYSTDPKYLDISNVDWKRYSKYIDWTLYRRIILTFGKLNQKLGYSTEIEMNIISQNNLENTNWSIMGMGQSPLFKLTTGKLRIVMGNNADSYVSVYMNDELVARRQRVSVQGISLYCLQMTAGTNLQFDSLKIKRIKLIK